MVAKVVITVKNEEKKLVTDHLVYDKFVAHQDDETVKSLVDDTVKQFKDEVESINVRINLEIK